MYYKINTDVDTIQRPYTQYIDKAMDGHYPRIIMCCLKPFRAALAPLGFVYLGLKKAHGFLECLEQSIIHSRTHHPPLRMLKNCGVFLISYLAITAEILHNVVKAIYYIATFACLQIPMALLLIPVILLRDKAARHYSPNSLILEWFKKTLVISAVHVCSAIYDNATSLLRISLIMPINLMISFVKIPIIGRMYDTIQDITVIAEKTLIKNKQYTYPAHMQSSAECLPGSLQTLSNMLKPKHGYWNIHSPFSPTLLPPGHHDIFGIMENEAYPKKLRDHNLRQYALYQKHKKQDADTRFIDLSINAFTVLCFLPTDIKATESLLYKMHELLRVGNDTKHQYTAAKHIHTLEAHTAYDNPDNLKPQEGRNTYVYHKLPPKLTPLVQGAMEIISSHQKEYTPSLTDRAAEHNQLNKQVVLSHTPLTTLNVTRIGTKAQDANPATKDLPAIPAATQHKTQNRLQNH